MALARSRFALFALILVPLFILLVVGTYAWKTGRFTAAKRSPYQAVFLTNGQVYFGHVRNAAAQYVILSEIYYLRSIQPLQEPQPAEGEKKGKEAALSAEPEFTLVKLGDELHGPEDRMEINRDQILFIEDLRENGKVVEAIKRSRAGKQ